MRALWAGVLFTTLACARAPVDFDARKQAVLNGEDDRLEVFQAPAQMQGPLLGASAALVYEHHLLERAPDSVSLRTLPATTMLGLCEDEPFGREPVAAFCSAVLIDDDLVATAGHCLGADAELAARRCVDLRIVFGYALSASDRPIELESEQVFACRKVVALDQDVAIVQLIERCPLHCPPRPLTAQPARVGDALVVASHGAGLPLKLEIAADVTQISAESGALTVAMDTFAGSSGGGLYNQSLELVALATNGDADWEAVDGCTRAAHSDVPREHALAAGSLVQAVCGAAWPSRRLCVTEPRCGDGICSGSEAADCGLDCAAPRCGDSLCEPAERGFCREDCARYQDVPESWLGDPASYARARGGGETSSMAAAGCSLSTPLRGAVPIPTRASTAAPASQSVRSKPFSRKARSSTTNAAGFP